MNPKTPLLEESQKKAERRIFCFGFKGLCLTFVITFLVVGITLAITGTTVVGILAIINNNHNNESLKGDVFFYVFRSSTHKDENNFDYIESTPTQTEGVCKNNLIINRTVIQLNQKTKSVKFHYFGNAKFSLNSNHCYGSYYNFRRMKQDNLLFLYVDHHIHFDHNVQEKKDHFIIYDIPNSRIIFQKQISHEVFKDSQMCYVDGFFVDYARKLLFFVYSCAFDHKEVYLQYLNLTNEIFSDFIFIQNTSISSDAAFSFVNKTHFLIQIGNIESAISGNFFFLNLNTFRLLPVIAHGNFIFPSQYLQVNSTDKPWNFVSKEGSLKISEFDITEELSFQSSLMFEYNGCYQNFGEYFSRPNSISLASGPIDIKNHLYVSCRRDDDTFIDPHLFDFDLENKTTTQYTYTGSPLDQYKLVQLTHSKLWTCHGVSLFDKSVCSQHGVCFSQNTCNCDIGYYGEECNKFTCFGKYPNDTTVCSSHGICIDANTCKCKENWIGDECQYPDFTCFGKKTTDPNVCSGHGSCIDNDVCKCDEQWTGQECNEKIPEPITCYGKKPEDPSVCSGNGECIEKDTCKCFFGWEGDQCEIAQKDFKYDPSEALKNAKYSGAAYCDIEKVLKWDCEICQSITQILPPTRTVLDFGIDHYTFGYVAINDFEKKVIVAFRGTEGVPTDISFNSIKSLLNWQTNLDFRATQFKDHTDMFVHKGFYDSYMSIKSQVRSTVKEVMKLLPDDWSITVTGHSLGGALATICAIDIVEELDIPQNKILVYTFGQPRVGGIEFAKYFNSKVSAFRVVHYNDVVPKLPVTTTELDVYMHVGTEVWYDDESFTSHYIVCQKNIEDPSCSMLHSIDMSSLTSHVVYLNLQITRLCEECIPSPDECNRGLWGECCNLDCPDVCDDGKCNKIHGYCDKCKTKFWGIECTKGCPVNCYDDVCFRNNGNCLKGCKKGFWGEKCENSCPDGCKEERCLRNGVCEECGRSGDTRFWGDKCENICPQNCAYRKGASCNKIDGTCIGHCNDGFWGDSCLNVCSCSRPAHCYKYDGHCPSDRCSDYCKEPCKKGDDYCSEEGCIPGYFEFQCDSRCSPNCKENVCSKSGECECGVGFWRTGKCDKKCPYGCVNNDCDSVTGDCRWTVFEDYCNQNYYSSSANLKKCDNKCNENCVDEICESDYGKCKFGCVKGFIGDFCDNPNY